MNRYALKQTFLCTFGRHHWSVSLNPVTREKRARQCMWCLKRQEPKVVWRRG